MTQLPPFQPLNARLAGLPVDTALHEGVPEWLDAPLHDWLASTFRDEGREAEHLAKRVLLRLRWSKSGPVQLTYVGRLQMTMGMALLIAVDALLQLHPGWDKSPLPSGGGFHARLAGLAEILTDAGSLYRIDPYGRCLVRRVDATVQAAADEAISTATATAADHLRASWVAAYGLNPDPDKAYDQAVLAIEEVICPLVSPQNSKATLGTVIADLKNQAALWELSIGDTGTGQPATIDGFTKMLELLWKGQSRHGGSANSRQQTQAEGEAAVHMAATLTQWLTAGVLRRKP